MSRAGGESISRGDGGAFVFPDAGDNPPPVPAPDGQARGVVHQTVQEVGVLLRRERADTVVMSGTSPMCAVQAACE